eukprot:TRINITY_DN3642_c0_g1_i1.p1 TRINITY_DN3642_c0_g1~~TRINITY_DN3642_c0_g1_i1.p1  ORF type:complete len:1024 (+),score=104.43 TRINITY_DN3642_c0_g1_i1:365-3436(+)
MSCRVKVDNMMPIYRSISLSTQIFPQLTFNLLLSLLCARKRPMALQFRYVAGALCPSLISRFILISTKALLGFCYFLLTNVFILGLTSIVITKKGPKVDYSSAKVMQENLVKAVKKLLPANCVCGPADSLAGFKTRYFPSRIEKLLESSALECPLAPSIKLYINSCIIQVSPTFEPRLHDSVQSLYTSEEAKVAISEYRLHIGSHNQWTFVNTRGIRNSIACSLDSGSIKASGILTVDGVLPGNKMTLIFQLVASLKIVRPEQPVEHIAIVVGEYVYVRKFVADKGEGENIEVYGTMSTESVTGDCIWSPPVLSPKEEWSMTIICDASPATEQPKEKPAMDSAAAEEIRKLEELKRKREEQRKALEVEKEKAYRERESKLKEQALKLKQKEEELKKQREILRSASKKINPVSPPKTPAETPKSIIQKPVIETPQLPEPADIEEDIKNELKASLITIDFLGFKPRGPLLAYNDLVPSKICIATKFFNFPLVQSPFMELRKIKPHPEAPMALLLGGEVPKWTNVSSMDLNGKLLRLQFECDPAVDSFIPMEILYEDFLRYLARNILKIYLFNGEGLTPIGSCKVYLADLLRNKDAIKSVKKEYDVFTEDRQLVGSLQISLQNIGQRHKEAAAVLSKTENMVKSKKKVKIRSKPLTVKDLAKISQLDHASTQSEELRKAELVYQYKLHMNASMTTRHKAQWYSDPLLEDIEKYRTVSRIMNISEKFAVQREELSAPMPYFLGQLGLCPVVFTNPYDQPALFCLEIYDPEKKDEFKLVTDPHEWKYLCQKGGYDGPYDWKMLKDSPNFLLRANQQVLLLFKMFCLVPPAKNERDLRITIKLHQNSQIMQQNTIKAMYKETYYNGYFICNESENTLAELTLVPDIYSRNFEKARCALCSVPSIAPKITENAVKLNCTVKKEQELYVFVYADEYYYETICILHVLVRPHKTLEVNTAAGSKIVQNFTLSSHGIGRDIKLYSSNPKVVKMAEGFAEYFEIPEGQSRSIPLCITPYKIGEYKEYIYCKGSI